MAGMSLRVSRGVVGLCVAAGVGGLSATALASAPEKGRSYVGTVGQGTGNGAPNGPTGARVSFKVSANGSSISDFHAPAYSACSGASGVSLPTTAKIKNGGFTIKFTEGGFSVVYRGAFLAGGRAKGTIVTKVQNPFGGTCTGTWPWTAKPLPTTSSICPDHTGPPGRPPGAYYTNIVANHVPCKTVYGALDSGKFNAKTLAFSTVGWSCTGANGAYECKRTKHPASFTFNSNETCGRFGAPKSPQCVTPAAADRPR